MLSEPFVLLRDLTISKSHSKAHWIILQTHSFFANKTQPYLAPLLFRKIKDYRFFFFFHLIKYMITWVSYETVTLCYIGIITLGYWKGAVVIAIITGNKHPNQWKWSERYTNLPSSPTPQLRNETYQWG